VCRFNGSFRSSSRGGLCLPCSSTSADSLSAPLCVQSLTNTEQEEVETALRSEEASALRRAQIVQLSARGKRPIRIADQPGCSDQSGRNAIHDFNEEGSERLHRPTRSSSSGRPWPRPVQGLSFYPSLLRCTPQFRDACRPNHSQPNQPNRRFRDECGPEEDFDLGCVVRYPDVRFYPSLPARREEHASFLSVVPRLCTGTAPSFGGSANRRFHRAEDCPP